ERRRAPPAAPRGRIETSPLGPRAEHNTVSDPGTVGRLPTLLPSGLSFQPSSLSSCRSLATGIIKVSPTAQGDRCEGRYPPQVLRGRGPLRVRSDLEDAFDQARVASGNLLELPPVLHGQAEASRHRGPRRALHEEIRRADDSEPQGRGKDEQV